MKREQHSWWLEGTVAAWAAATVLCAWAHVVVWRETAPAGAGQTHESFAMAAAKIVTNVVHTINAPVWLAWWRVFGDHRSLGSAIGANGIGFALWLLALFIAWQVWRGWRRPKPTLTQVDSGAASASEPAVVSRRRFLVDGAGAAIALGACASGASATLITPWSFAVRRYTLALPGLPRELEGLRLAQVTDTHLGPRIPESHIEEAVRLALSLRPDLILLTGDYVHNGSRQIEPVARVLGPLAADRATPIGAVGVLGNHDHYVNAPAVAAAMRSIGVRMIDNDRVYIDAATRRLTDSPPATGVCLAGVGDLYMDRIDLDRALRDAPRGMPRILLSHNPDVAEMPELRRRDDPGRGRVDAMLSGHTHGGQVRLPLIGAPIVPSRFGQRYVHGLVQGPVCPVVVSAGVGLSLLPVRFGVAPEIVEVTLVRA